MMARLLGTQITVRISIQFYVTREQTSMLEYLDNKMHLMGCRQKAKSWTCPAWIQQTICHWKYCSGNEGMIDLFLNYYGCLYNSGCLIAQLVDNKYTRLWATYVCRACIWAHLMRTWVYLILIDRIISKRVHITYLLMDFGWGNMELLVSMATYA